MNTKYFWAGFTKKAYLEKRPYKSMDISTLDPEKQTEAWTAKIDGAHTVIEMKKGQKPKLFSHRMSKRTGGPIDYTEKLPHVKKNSPVNAVLRGETYAIDSQGKVVDPEIITSVLNSGLQKSLDFQKRIGIKTQTALIDIDRYNGKDVSKLPFQQKRKLLEQIAKKDKNFVLPAIAIKPEEKQLLRQAILNKKHPQTKEGLIVHDYSVGSNFSKAKVIDDHDVFVREIFTEIGSIGRESMAGGFEYSWEANGPIVGKVGTGFNHNMKKDMLRNPQKYIGRVARVKALGVSKTNVLLKPSFVAWHVEKNIGTISPLTKQTIIVNKSIAPDRDTAKAIAKEFADRLYTSRQTDSSYRFRQAPPSKFDPKSYKTYSPKPGVSIVYGELKEE